jgi:hypothetical protein
MYYLENAFLVNFPDTAFLAANRNETTVVNTIAISNDEIVK